MREIYLSLKPAATSFEAASYQPQELERDGEAEGLSGNSQVVRFRFVTHANYTSSFQGYSMSNSERVVRVASGQGFWAIGWKLLTSGARAGTSTISCSTISPKSRCPFCKSRRNATRKWGTHATSLANGECVAAGVVDKGVKVIANAAGESESVRERGDCGW